MKIAQCPCAADALFGTGTITVSGKTVGIARLCDALADVRAMDLTGENALREALVSRVGQDNYIPASLRREYDDALFAVYRRTLTTGAGADRS